MFDKFLKQKRITIIGITLILLCLNLSNVYAEVSTKEQKNVLIINSYHQGFKWSKDETDGIIDTLNKSSNNLAIFIEYMDWKNYPYVESIQLLTDFIKYKYQDKSIDVVMATDDVALMFWIFELSMILRLITVSV